eukprot:s7_g83.t1
MTKRKSSGSAGHAPKPKAAKAKASKGDSGLKVPPDALKLPHLKLFEEWAQEHLMQKQKTLDVFLSEMLLQEDCFANEKAFYEWIESTFPPDPSLSWTYHFLLSMESYGDVQAVPIPNFQMLRTYSAESDLLTEGGSLQLRPWHLPHRSFSVVFATTVKPDGNLAHECVSSFAAAYSLGEKESAAAVNLLKHSIAGLFGHSSVAFSKSKALLGSINGIERIPDLIQDKYKGTHADALMAITEKLSQETRVLAAVKANHENSSVNADGTQVPMSYRWKVSPDAKVKVGEGVPCVITPVKPKYYLLGQLSIKANTAIKLK